MTQGRFDNRSDLPLVLFLLFCCCFVFVSFCWALLYFSITNTCDAGHATDLCNAPGARAKDTHDVNHFFCLSTSKDKDHLSTLNENCSVNCHVINSTDHLPGKCMRVELIERARRRDPSRAKLEAKANVFCLCLLLVWIAYCPTGIFLLRHAMNDGSIVVIIVQFNH